MTAEGPGVPRATEDVQILLTAAEAYPVLERAFLDARTAISAGFRVFDPDTRLHSPEGQAVGETWAELVAHTLSRGVAFRLILSDFDPVVRPALHRGTHRAVASLRAAGETSGRPELLTVEASMHAARIGIAPRLFLWSRILRELQEEIARLNALDRKEAEADLALMPGLAPHVTGAHPRLRARAWPVPPLIPTTHHQKLAVFDDETLFVGGLDLDDRRFDTPDHQRAGSETWADVQLLVRGPVAREARFHLDEMGAVIDGAARAIPRPGLVRTLSSRQPRAMFRMSPRPVVTEIEQAHLHQIETATTLIYLETQFMRSRLIAKALARRARAAHDLKMLLVLPAAPEDVAFEGNSKADSRYGEYLQANCLDILRAAFGTRLFVVAPGQPRPTNEAGRGTIAGAPLVYLHSKVSIFDDRAAIVSSANLNGRSLRWDTEVGVPLTDPATVRALRLRCLKHWLPEDAEARFLETSTLIEAWRALADDNAGRSPSDRMGFVMPYPSAPARRFGRNLPGVPEEMV